MTFCPVSLTRKASATLAAALSLLCGTGSHAQQGEAPRFDILEFVVEGDTVLGSASIERAVYPFLGENRSAADAEGARKALEKAYQDAGFLSVAVTLPPQAVAGGEVRLVVVAAPVGRLRVTGAEYQLPSQVREALPSVAPGVVPNFNEFQQERAQLELARPDTQITPLLSAGERPGTLDIELQQKDTLPLHGSAEINNKQTPGTDRGRLEANLRWDNLFQRRHSLGLAWTVSPTEPSQSNIATLTYALPLGGVGDRLFAVFTTSDSDTPTAFGGLTVSRGQTSRLRWRDRLEAPSALGLDHALTLGLTHRALKARNQGVGGVDVESPSLNYSTLQASYELTHTPGGPGAEGPATRTALVAGLTLGLPGLTLRTVDCSGEPRDQFDCKRKNASGRFQVFNLTLDHTRPVGSWTLELALQAQFSDAPLVDAEQAVYGGVDSVRGYLEGEQAGDLGGAARIDLVSPSWQPLEGLSLRGHAFYDHALLKRLYALPSEEAQTQLASAGLGLRVATRFGLEGTLHWARLLRNSRRANDGGTLVPASGTAAGVRERFGLAIRQAF